MDEPRYCIRIEGSAQKVDSAKCEDPDYTANVNLAKSDGDTESNHTYPDFDAISENDMIKYNSRILNNFVAGEDVTSTKLHGRATKPCYFIGYIPQRGQGVGILQPRPIPSSRLQTIRTTARQLKINVITKSLESTLIGCRVRVGP